jgi:hypothetical protein
LVKVEAFEEVVKELDKKYDVSVHPKVIRAIVKVVDRDLKNLAKKEMLTQKGVRKYYRKAYPKVWCMRKPWRSVNDLIKQLAEKRHLEVSSEVRLELSRFYSSLTADTLFAAAAFVVLTRGRKKNPVTMDDVELVCKEFLKLKPTWLC